MLDRNRASSVRWITWRRVTERFRKRVGLMLERILSGTATGEWIDLRTGDDAADLPVKGRNWGEEREVEATHLAAAITEEGDGRHLRLAGARVRGVLDLEGAEIQAHHQMVLT
jgi:hypothetical protein